MKRFALTAAPGSAGQTPASAKIAAILWLRSTHNLSVQEEAPDLSGSGLEPGFLRYCWSVRLSLPSGRAKSFLANRGTIPKLASRLPPRPHPRLHTRPHPLRLSQIL